MAKRKTPEEIAEAKRLLRESTKAAIKNLRDAAAKKSTAMNAAHRVAKVAATRAQKKRDDHAKVLLGVWSINLYQTSAPFRKFADGKLAEFFSDAPLRLEAARQGLTIKVVKPSKDTDPL